MVDPADTGRRLYALARVGADGPGRSVRRAGDAVGGRSVVAWVTRWLSVARWVEFEVVDAFARGASDPLGLNHILRRAPYTDRHRRRSIRVRNRLDNGQRVRTIADQFTLVLDFIEVVEGHPRCRTRSDATCSGSSDARTVSPCGRQVGGGDVGGIDRRRIAVARLLQQRHTVGGYNRRVRLPPRPGRRRSSAGSTWRCAGFRGERRPGGFSRHQPFLAARAQQRRVYQIGPVGRALA